jgi:hypothetical protein
LTLSAPNTWRHYEPRTNSGGQFGTEAHIRAGNQDSHLLEKEVTLLRRLLERYTNDIESEADGAVVFDGERLNPIRPA